MIVLKTSARLLMLAALAALAGAKPAEYFELTEPGARDAVKVDFAA